jgi:DNA-binding MarR family transcriptional regulator
VRNISLPEELAREVDALEGLLCELGHKCSLRDPIAGAVEELRFTPAQVHAILWLGRDGALTMGELARRLGITEKTITGVVDRLERERHLSRVRDEEDRRVVRVRLTKKGEASYQRLNAHVREKLATILGLLDREDRQALKKLLRKLIARMPGEVEAA